MNIPFEFNFKQPNYTKVWAWRLALIQRIRETGTIDAFKAYYKHNPAAFISHWGSTYEPRNAEIDLPTTIPFILFERQVEFVDWLIARWRNRQPGICEKSRDCGISWLTMATASTLSLFNDGLAFGFGSAKEDKVDRKGDPDCLFEKARFFLTRLPRDFLGNWNIKNDASFLRILFPDTGSTITGEAGDNIGRGGRKSIYVIDESAHIERPKLIDASLSATTNCRIDVSSVAGMENSFAEKRHGGKIDVFTFHWRSDPRKDDAWYEKQKNDLDPVTIAQEIDINYQASVEGVLLPSEWVQAAIDADIKLKFSLTGSIEAGLDVADEGIDKNSFAVKHGIGLVAIEEWSGKNSDTLYTAERAFTLSDEFLCQRFLYDADGIGSSIRGDSRLINERRKINGQRQIVVNPFRGSGSVLAPESQMVKGRKNKDFFQNFKAQSAWHLRLLFRNTFRAVNGDEYDPDQIISIPSKLKLISKLIIELSQPTYGPNIAGKIVVNKKPDNTKSPNLFDSVMIVYSPRKFGLFS